MVKIYVLLSLLFLSTKIFSQCANETVTWVDSTGKEIPYEVKWLCLNGSFYGPLEDLQLTKFNGLPLRMPYIETELDSNELLELSMVGQIKKETDYSKINCISCLVETLQKLDSVDLNKDGVKELIILRKGTCTSSPAITRECCGVGVKQQSASQYEVWDVVSKKRIYTIRNEYYFTEALTVNVGYTDSYRFDVHFDKSGLIKLSNHRGNIFPMEMGTYKFDPITQEFLYAKPK